MALTVEPAAWTSLPSSSCVTTGRERRLKRSFWTGRKRERRLAQQHTDAYELVVTLATLPRDLT